MNQFYFYAEQFYETKSDALEAAGNQEGSLGTNPPVTLNTKKSINGLAKEYKRLRSEGKTIEQALHMAQWFSFCEKCEDSFDVDLVNIHELLDGRHIQACNRCAQKGLI